MAYENSSRPHKQPGAPAKEHGPGQARPIRRSAAVVVTLLAVVLSGCRQGPSPEAQRIEQLNLKIQQLEQRLNKLASEKRDGSDPRGKPPVGAIKSLTLRTGTEDDRLRIYWADGSTTNLPCTKEQATFVCG